MLSNRRCRVPEELYDYHNKLIKHPSVSALDLESGKWFSCKQCKSPRDKEGKFFCKTASGQNAGTIRHAEMKSHKDKQQQADLPQQDNMRVVWLTPSPHSPGCCDGGGVSTPPPCLLVGSCCRGGVDPSLAIWNCCCGGSTPPPREQSLNCYCRGGGLLCKDI
jgi:hypothetical protein